MTSPAALRLDRATMRQNLDRFKLRWRDRLDGWGSADQGALEREYAQSYWSELFECFGVTAYRYVTDWMWIRGSWYRESA